MACPYTPIEVCVNLQALATVEPRFNEPLFNKFLDITNNTLRPRQNYSKMYGIEPRYNEFLDITNIIRKPKRKIYLDITNYNVNRRQKINADQQSKDQQSANPLIFMVKRQQPFSQRIIISYRHWHYSICTEVTCVLQSIINYDLDIMNILVVSLQICYVKVFNITSPLFKVAQNSFWHFPRHRF